MAPSIKHRDIPWLEETSPELSQRAAEEVQAILEPATSPKWLVFSGLCPACRGAISHRQPIQVFLTEDAAALGNSGSLISHPAVEPYRAIIWCDCKLRHKGADGNVTGCGRYFALDIEVQD